MPAFVEIIKQLTSDEAKLIGLLAKYDYRAFPLLTVRWDYKNPTTEKRGGKDVIVNFSLLGDEASCEFSANTPIYLDNLLRLGLIDIPQNFEYTALGIYDALEKHITVLEAKKRIEDNTEIVPTIVHKGLLVTELGKLFCRVCVIPHDQIVK